MRCVAVVLLVLPLPAAAENLLVNPGFERLERGMPTGWHVFVAPMDGAEGSIDAENVQAGRYAVRLHNPKPYDTEPANNWSQNILEDLGGQKLVVSGSIKTREATEAAIWIQCFRKHPWGALLFDTTSTDSPVYDTTDWTRVEMQIEVPRGTDFLVLRCVLKGRGTAWFDSVAVEDAQSADRSPGLRRPDTLGNARHRTPEPPASPARPETVDTTDVRDRLAETLEAAVVANRELRETNKQLAEQIRALNEDLRQLRVDIVKATESPRPVPPPLMPHGYDWERMLR